MSNLLNILILDDNKHKHDLIESRFPKVLSSLGFNFSFCECETVQQAFDALKETSFDILCLDHELQGETGFDLLSLWIEKIAEVKPQGHVILHSGNPYKAIQMMALTKEIKRQHPNSNLSSCATQLTFSHHYEFWYENVATPFFEGKGTSCHPLQAK